MKRIVRECIWAALAASTITCLISLMPLVTAENSMKLAFGRFGNDLGQRGFAHARRTPEDHRAGIVALDLHAQTACRGRPGAPARATRPGCAAASVSASGAIAWSGLLEECECRVSGLSVEQVHRRAPRWSSRAAAQQPTAAAPLHTATRWPRRRRSGSPPDRGRES